MPEKLEQQEREGEEEEERQQQDPEGGDDDEVGHCGLLVWRVRGRWAILSCWCGGYAGGWPFYLAGVEGTREVGHSFLLVWRVRGRWAW